MPSQRASPHLHSLSFRTAQFSDPTSVLSCFRRTYKQFVRLTLSCQREQTSQKIMYDPASLSSGCSYPFVPLNSKDSSVVSWLLKYFEVRLSASCREDALRKWHVSSMSFAFSLYFICRKWKRRGSFR